MHIKSRLRTSSLAVAVVIWLVLLAAGFLILVHEAYSAVPVTRAMGEFPANGPLSLDLREPTLIVFARPQCPCTRATFVELDELRAQTSNGVSVTVVFTLPPQVPAGWEEGDLLTYARKMAGVHIILDRGGSIAREFGVVGSGHVLVYTPTGQLVFSGGITPSRGHEGDSAGRTAIVLLARGQSTSTTIRQPVFGCTLL
jgi:hypothetical protein